MIKPRLLLFSIFMLSLSLPVFAQTTVTGTVTNAQTGEPLNGVNIIVRGGSNLGTTTDMDGYYSITVPSPQDTLLFTYVGFESKVIAIDGRTTIDVELTPRIQRMKDLVVIGYGTQRKENVTGAISEIGAADFKEGAVTSLGELFQGKVAGVTVTSGGGAPGSAPVIRIRGGSSLSASNAPLYVINGVPITGGISGMRNPLNTINPNDIASITILKDASATAIYGSRASNGVIIITTKEGRIGQPIRVSYSANFSYQRIKDMIDVLSADKFREVIKINLDRGLPVILVIPVQIGKN